MTVVAKTRIKYRGEYHEAGIPFFIEDKDMIFFKDIAEVVQENKNEKEKGAGTNGGDGEDRLSVEQAEYLTIPVSKNKLRNAVSKIDDIELLNKLLATDARNTAIEIYQNRLKELADV